MKYSSRMSLGYWFKACCSTDRACECLFCLIKRMALISAKFGCLSSDTGAFEINFSASSISCSGLVMRRLSSVMYAYWLLGSVSNILYKTCFVISRDASDGAVHSRTSASPVNAWIFLGSNAKAFWYSLMAAWMLTSIRKYCWACFMCDSTFTSCPFVAVVLLRVSCFIGL